MSPAAAFSYVYVHMDGGREREALFLLSQGQTGRKGRLVLSLPPPPPPHVWHRPPFLRRRGHRKGGGSEEEEGEGVLN